MNKLRWLAILMGAVMLVITGFQLYWLRDNYKREKKTATDRASLLFRETVLDLKDSLLQVKLHRVLQDSNVTGTKRKFVQGPLRKPFPGIPGAARVINILGQKMMADSLHKTKGGKGVFITLEANTEISGLDSTGRLRLNIDSLHASRVDELVVVNRTGDARQLEKDSSPGRAARRNNQKETVSLSTKTGTDSNHKGPHGIQSIFINNEEGQHYRVSIDSLFNEPITAEQLSDVFRKKLQAEKLEIPFTVLQEPEKIPEGEVLFTGMSPEDSIGGYKLQLGNAFSFLIKKISLPILFSVFLVGLTILSFVLLYRSLLRQHRLSEMKNDLISNITHELKTPIATVGVAIEALKNFNALQDPAKTKEYLDISQNELQRLGLLVDKVLKLSMFENKEIEIKYEVFDLEEAVKEVTASLRLQLEKLNARIEVITEGDLLIRADRMHLLSVVFNLLDNALKYGKENPVINVLIKEGGESIVVKIEDNGIGIPVQYKDKVFEKFFRVPTGDTHNAKGHGLGLSYVARVVHQHKGSITVDSQEGKGTVFSITLPKNL